MVAAMALEVAAKAQEAAAKAWAVVLVAMVAVAVGSGTHSRYNPSRECTRCSNSPAHHRRNRRQRKTGKTRGSSRRLAGAIEAVSEVVGAGGLAGARALAAGRTRPTVCLRSSCSTRWCFPRPGCGSSWSAGRHQDTRSALCVCGAPAPPTPGRRSRRA